MAKRYLTKESGVTVLKEAKATSSGAPDAGELAALGSDGKFHISLMPTGIGAQTKVLPASESLSAGNMVNIWDDSGTLKVRKADASSAAKSAHGFIIESYTTSANATVYLDGTLTGLSGLAVNSKYFLSNETPGAFTTTPPDDTDVNSIMQIVGYAVSATELSFKPLEPVLIL